jgi:hypothetical protein
MPLGYDRVCSLPYVVFAFEMRSGRQWRRVGERGVGTL